MTSGLPWGYFLPCRVYTEFDVSKFTFPFVPVTGGPSFGILGQGCILGGTQFTVSKDRITGAYKTQLYKAHGLAFPATSISWCGLSRMSKTLSQALGWQRYHLHMIPNLLPPVPSDLHFLKSTISPLFLMYFNGRITSNCFWNGHAALETCSACAFMIQGRWLCPLPCDFLS